MFGVTDMLWAHISRRHMQKRQPKMVCHVNFCGKELFNDDEIIEHYLTTHKDQVDSAVGFRLVTIRDTSTNKILSVNRGILW